MVEPHSPQDEDARHDREREAAAGATRQARLALFFALILLAGVVGALALAAQVLISRTQIAADRRTPLPDDTIVSPEGQAAVSTGSRNGDSSSSTVLFQDDFSNPFSGWDSYEDGEYLTDYTDGSYRIYVNVDNTDVWANPGKDFTDVRVEVDATKVDGPNDNDFGIICRYQDEDNFYILMISSDGFYGIAKLKNGDLSLIDMDSMSPSDDIYQGKATNRIRADCVGDTFSLYANGKLLGEVRDDDFNSGDVGLLAGTYDTTGTDIRFDNFIVREP